MNPVALIVTPVSPMAPEVGDRPVAAETIVKLVAELATLVPSDTLTVCGPAGAAGTVKVIVELPLESEVPPEVIDALAPPTVTVSACEAMNPVALIVTPVVPTVPLVGDGAPTAGVVTVKFV